MSLIQQIEPALASVFITPELDTRPAEPADYLREKMAILDLAGRMADHPEEVLPRFVDLAMEITGGVSAGLSLFEPEPDPGVFRWRYLRGTLSPFENALTPRNFSPCGVTLDQNRPVLALHPERAYDWIADADIVVPEVLLVPLYLGDATPVGTLWIVSRAEGHFHRGHARAMTELASFVGVALRMVRTEQQLRQALDEQEILTKEMGHRVKNLFAVIDAMIRLGARGAATKDEMATSLSGRLHALASAHTLVSRNLREVGRAPRASDIETVIQAVTSPHDYAAEGASSRFRVTGPSVPCGDRAVNGIALVFHELATNAAKYGALSNNQGQVEIRWVRDGDKLRLDWVESGGPPVERPPQTSGFGGTLVKTTVAGQLGGELSYDWKPGGLAVAMTLALDKIAL